MKRDGEAFVGIDTAKTRNAVAIAEAGRSGEVRYLGEFDNTPEAVAKLVRKLAERHQTLHFCYEAGPTGYGLHRQIRSLKQDCIVVAPSLIPRRPGERVKTNRRDAQGLARLLRAGELTADGCRTRHMRRCGTSCAPGRWRCRMTAVNASTSAPFCFAWDAATLAVRHGLDGISAGSRNRTSRIRRSDWLSRRC